jgi:uncharacterized protein YcsI (UPF0317 family)
MNQDGARPEPFAVAEYATPSAARAAARAGRLRGYTSRCAPAYMQANLAILPAVDAEEFLRFCQRNPQPCPLLDVSEPGEFRLSRLGAELDIRSDVPAYYVFREGEFIDEVHDIFSYWRDDLVTFALGCSLSVDQALLNAGIPVRHLERNESAGMYVTNIETVPAGRFMGPMVVTMRPHHPADAIRAVQITTRFPKCHGAPVHIGLPELIGIRDLRHPDFGPNTVVIAKNEIPVFWACGVTPQVVIRHAKPSLCITHKPGHMLITDLRSERLSLL